MDHVMFNVIFFSVLFLLVFGVYYLGIYRRRLKKEQYAKMAEINYLVSRFSLNRAKMNFGNVIFVVCLIDAFIISFVATVITLLPIKVIWQLLIGFVLLFALIYALYEIYGRILQKKWGMKK